MKAQKLTPEEIALRLKEGYTLANGRHVKPEQINPETGRMFKFGGRRKGTKNKHSNIDSKIKDIIIDREKIRVDRFLDKNLTPQAYLFTVFNDESKDIEHRMKAAIACLPYVHGKRPNQVELSGRDGKDLNLGNASALQKLEGLLIQGIEAIDADDAVSNETESEALLTEYHEVHEPEQSSTERAEEVLQRAKDSLR